VPGIGGARGYTPFGVETAKGATHHDLKEFWQVGRELPPGHRYRCSMPDNVWIKDDPGFRSPCSSCGMRSTAWGASCSNRSRLT
jgi:isopenicillin N synthase-like dioxygenase